MMDDSGAAAKFSVRSWQAVSLKYRVIDLFCGKYSVEAMCEGVRGKPQRVFCIIELIAWCQQLCKQADGICRVWRWIQRQAGKSVNLKAILCSMRKLNLL